MHFAITTKKFHISDKDYQYIEKFVKRLVQFVPWKNSDYPLLDVILRKHKKKSLNHIEKKLVSEDSVNPLHGHKTVDNPVYYDGTLDLILPKKRLVVKVLGKTVNEAIKKSFDAVFAELEKYKGLHFVDDSEYFNHRKIREKL